MRTDELLMQIRYDLELNRRKIAVFEMHTMTPEQFNAVPRLASYQQALNAQQGGGWPIQDLQNHFRNAGLYP